jgi:hypothetical protein
MDEKHANAQQFDKKEKGLFSSLALVLSTHFEFGRPYVVLQEHASTMLRSEGALSTWTSFTIKIVWLLGFSTPGKSEADNVFGVAHIIHDVQVLTQHVLDRRVCAAFLVLSTS